MTRSARAHHIQNDLATSTRTAHFELARRRAELLRREDAAKPRTSQRLRPPKAGTGAVHAALWVNGEWIGAELRRVEEGRFALRYQGALLLGSEGSVALRCGQVAGHTLSVRADVLSCRRDARGTTVTLRARSAAMRSSRSDLFAALRAGLAVAMPTALAFVPMSEGDGHRYSFDAAGANQTQSLGSK